MVRSALTADFNRISQAPALYNPATFNAAGFSEHLQQQIERFQKAPPKGDDVVRWNHWLIEELFPGTIQTSMRWSDKQYGYINSAFSGARYKTAANEAVPSPTSLQSCDVGDGTASLAAVLYRFYL